MRKRMLIIAMVAVLLVAMLPAAASAQGCTTQYYRVQRGDTLFRIATRYGVNMYTLAQVNGIANINRIFVGQVLTIPCGTPAPAPPSTSCTHIVQRGEWLSVIARRYGVSLWAIASTNGISNPNWIYPGQRLVIPYCTPTPPPPAPTPTPPAPWPPWPGPAPAPECSIMPVLGFGRVWTEQPAARAKLGCPVAAEFTVSGAEQYFQNGIVVWRSDQDPVTVIYRSGTWGTLPDPWDDCHCTTPLTPYVGWPSSARWEGPVAVQNFAGGTMLWTACCGFYVLYGDGTWAHFS